MPVGEAVLVELIPVDPAFLGPLGALAELLAHEQQLLARVGPLVGEQARAARPPSTWSLPGIRPHSVPLPCTTSSWLIGQHEVLAERVQHRERHLVVVVAAVHRVTLDELQRVVHPAHVPLHRKAKPAKVGRAGDAGPRRRLLGDGDDAGRQLVHGGVHLLQELHGLEVLPAAVDVRVSSRPPAASSPGTASMRPRRPAARRCGTPAASTARWPPGSCAPRRGRSRTHKCPSPVARRGAGRSARRARCRRSGPAPTRPSGSGRAPSP